MKVEYIPTDQLRAMAAPYNPRTISDHDLASLGRSMQTFGVVEPIVVNTRTGRIVGGHQRVKAAEARCTVERVRCCRRSTSASRSRSSRSRVARVRPRRATGVRHAASPVEHEAAGAFEKVAAFLENREIDDAVDPESADFLLQLVDDVATALAAPVPREQRIEDDCAVIVRAEPVVREDLVR